MKRLLPAITGSFIGSTAFGAGGGGIPHFINFYDLTRQAVGLGPEFNPVLGGFLVLILTTVLGLAYSRSVANAETHLKLPSKFGVRFIVEGLLDIVLSVAKDQCGEKASRFLTLLAGIFIFVLFGNLSGLIPGFPPPTENFSTNLAIGLLVFVCYNFAGFKELGAKGYLAHFAGPVLFIAPLFFCLEIISHASRPLSLALRLTGNIFGDHLLLAVFTGLTVFIFPALLLFFGLLVAFVQSFVFTLLTAIYINMAISHDH